ncbi:hypothetical protein B0A49_10874 [Cryomyces minteri]|uniref:BZIP domain-containing protein n=1 Tax=Cryomyces minteri TaxID=331657 RepID=A0A4U0WBN3_9PEZI|nr:hypothetical protein B0A49_10874 [Cryomyces minteri]
MSGYNGRRAPNVSQYIANLNQLPPAPDTVAQDDGLGFSDDLALFANTDFFDFDMGQNIADVPQSTIDYDPALEEKAKRHNASATSAKLNNAKSVDFGLDGPYQFSDFPDFPNIAPNTSVAPVLAPAPPNLYPSQPQIQSFASPASASSPATGSKRSYDATTMPQDQEEASRAAADEDKRRRNTAASARFRVKKKQREQALEKNNREMADKLAALEARVAELEKENKWLKGLVIEKNNSVESGTEHVEELYRKHTAETSQGEGRSTAERTDGVGTESAGAGDA